MAEVWRDVPGWPGYSVSSLGRVRSSKRGTPRELYSESDRDYRRVTVYRDGRPHHKGIHQLVALAFIGSCPEGMEVRHLDGDGSNNVPSNLAYGTSSTNQRDKVRHGTHNMARKTHCKRGHALSGTNVSFISLANGSTARRCKACARAAAAAARHRKRAAA